MVLLVVTADNHLGQYAARMPFARLEERRRRLREGFRRAVSYAVQHRAAAFLHAGDLFDTVDPRNLERVMVSQELARLQAAGITVVGIGGITIRPGTPGSTVATTPPIFTPPWAASTSAPPQTRRHRSSSSVTA